MKYKICSFVGMSTLHAETEQILMYHPTPSN